MRVIGLETQLNPVRHSRKPPSFPRTREPREKQITQFTLPFAKRRGRGAKRTQGMHGAESSPFPNPSLIPANHRHSRKPPSFPRTREPREKQITPFTLPFARRRGRGAQRTQGMHGADGLKPPTNTPFRRNRATFPRTRQPRVAGGWPMSTESPKTCKSLWQLTRRDIPEFS